MDRVSPPTIGFQSSLKRVVIAVVITGVTGKITLQPGNSISLKGLMDVGTNHRIVWKNVHSTVDIRGGKTITIFVDSKDTKNHFAGQPIYGVANSFIQCMDEPGPNMEVLPPCIPNTPK